MCQNEKCMTWQEMLDFCRSLTQEQLEMKVRWWGEEKGGVISHIDVLEEDYVSTDYCWEPLSVWEENKEDEDEQPDIAAVKGQPMLANFY